MNRRKLLKTFSASAAGAWSAAAGAQTFGFTPQQRYPDPSVYILDPSFAKYRIYSSTVEQLGTGMRWAEGPAYFPETGTLILSDIPNNRLMKYEEKTGKFSVHKENANYANGNARDRQGRLVTCEHSVTRRVVRTERDGSITVLADRYQGKRLNAPNDVVVKSDDSIWFTDPLFGINGEWEGSRATPEQAGTFVYRIGKDGQISAVITDLVNPNGLAFSPDEKKLYVVEWKGNPNRGVWSYDVSADGTSLSNKTKLIDADGPGAFDGLRVDRDGNLWCGWGSAAPSAPRPATSAAACARICHWAGPRRWTGSRSSIPAASRLASSACPNAAPILNSAVPSATACTWPAATRSTRSMWKPMARPEVFFLKARQ